MNSTPVQYASYPVRSSYPNAQAPTHAIDIESTASAVDAAEAARPGVIAGWTQRAAAALPLPFSQRSSNEAVHPVGGLSTATGSSSSAGGGCAKGALVGAVFGALGAAAFGIAGGVLRNDENRRLLGERLLEIGVPVSFVVPILMGSIIGSLVASGN